MPGSTAGETLAATPLNTYPIRWGEGEGDSAPVSGLVGVNVKASVPTNKLVNLLVT